VLLLFEVKRTQILSLILEKTFQASSVEAQVLIEKYDIVKIPTLIFSKDALEYDTVSQVWDKVGSQEEDGTLVLRYVNPPYRNVSTGLVEGLVDLTYIADETCSTCYDPKLLKELFEQSFGMKFSKDESVDVSSTKGGYLQRKYNITIVPTIILSKEASVYESVAQAWQQIGSTEKDGSLVLRDVEKLKAYYEEQGNQWGYKDLESGEISGVAPEETIDEAVNATEIDAVVEN